jgi:hypothetical protein
MNDGVKILVDRMQTHPEEFYGHYNRWTEIINNFEKFFNANERALINGALTNLRREEFTQIVMQEILREPTMVERESVTFRVQGRDPWGSSTLQIQEQALAEKQKMFEELYRDEINKLKAQNQVTKTKAEKNKTKMQQLLQNVTKKRQVY